MAHGHPLNFQHAFLARRSPMYLIVIAWLYVTVMMAAAEATNPQGSLLGAIVTFLFYGLGPAALVVYLMRAPARRRAIKAREAAESRAGETPPEESSVQPDAGGHAPGAAEADGVAPVRKET
jgi:hypothetical protein